MNRFANGSRGFTLVELLIVVAIIGVLATVGVPTFRKMTQKAKKSEAKVLLGGFFTAESAFQAEYGVFGNFLNKLGIEAGGGPTTYVVGFSTTGCVDDTVRKPDAAAAVTALTAQIPDYYTAAGFTTTMGPTTRPGGTACTAGTLAADGRSFTASANGVVSPKFAKNTTTATELDKWSMTDAKVLTNDQDGVQ